MNAGGSIKFAMFDDQLSSISEEQLTSISGTDPGPTSLTSFELFLIFRAH